MKILFYSHTGTVSGAENILLLALKRLDQSRFTPTAICPTEGNLAERIVALGVPCRTIAPIEARFTWRIDLLFKYLFSLCHTVKQLRAAIAETCPDIIHANSIRAGLAATAASVFTGKPVFWHLQDELPRHPLSTIIRLFAASSPRLRLIAASRATADSFRGLVFPVFKNETQLRVIHNAIELENFQTDPQSRKRIREEFGIGHSEFVVGIVGQITPRKGQLELIRNFAQALPQMPSSILLVVGAPMFNQDDWYLAELKRTARDLGLASRVRFTGKRNDVTDIMQALDVLAVNSQSEAFVIVALEAMACGTPVIATEVGGIREMIEHNVNGWLVPFGNDRLLCEALISLSRNREICTAFSKAGKRLVAERFNAEKFIKDLEGYFEESAGRTNERAAFLLAEY